MLATFSSVHTFFAMGSVNMQVISVTQARRRFRRLMRLLQEGQALQLCSHYSVSLGLVVRLQSRNGLAVQRVVSQ